MPVVNGIILPDIPVVELSNGLVVANYSSPHTFEFIDGNVLGECTEQRSKITELQIVEIPYAVKIRDTSITAVNVTYHLTWFLKEETRKIFKAYDEGDLPWDILITPLPLMLALKEYYCENAATPNALIRQNIQPFFGIRLFDRYTKVIHHNKFCV